MKIFSKNSIYSSIAITEQVKNTCTDFFTQACYALICIIIFTIFIENFIFSSNMGLLSFREIDDVAFQLVLRRVHILFQEGSYSKLLFINDYAYGWIFWMPLAIITYPLYLISSLLSVDWPLIIAPRQISLIFAVLSLIILRKILRRMKVPEWGCATALLIFSLYPTFGYFSLRFGTVNAVMFFSLLSLYLAQRDDPSTPRGRKLIAFTLAITGSIKLSGLLITPLIFGFVISRLQEKKLKDIIRVATIPTLIFLFSLITLTIPALLYLTSLPKIALHYLRELNHFISVTKIASNPLNPFEGFFFGLFGTVTNGMLMLFLIPGLLIYGFKEKKARIDVLTILLTLVCITIYLLINVKATSSTGYYFTSVSFLFLLGVAGFVRTYLGFTILITILTLMFIDFGSRVKNEIEGQLRWNHLHYFISSVKSQSDLINAENVQKCIGNLNNKAILVDFTAPITINPLSYPETIVSTSWNNLSPDNKLSDSINYLILDKMAVGYLPKIEFEKRVRESDPKISKGFLIDRATRIELTTTGKFGNQFFKPICEYGRVQVFKEK